MAYNDIEISQKKKINEYFKKNLNIDLDKYTEQERVEILKHLNETIDKKISEELDEYISLVDELEDMTGQY